MGGYPPREHRRREREGRYGVEEGREGENGAVRFEAVLALLPARLAKHQPRAAPPPPPERGEGERDEQQRSSPPLPAPGGKKREEAGAYILDLGGWKSEIAPYRAVRRDHGGAL